MKKSIIAMVLSVAMMLTMFPTGVLADDFIENTEGVTVSAEGQSNDDQGEESDTAQVNVDEDEETQPDTEKPETDQAAPDQTETNQTEQPEPGSTVPDQAGTTPDDKQPEPEQPATDPAENGVSDGAENTEGEQAESKTEFTVTWVSEGETILTKTFAEGTSKDEVENAQPAEDPVKEADGDVAYEFAGWTPDYADVTADQTYTAKFEEAEQDEMVSTASLVEPAANKGTYTVVAGGSITLKGSGEYSWSTHYWNTDAPEIATVSKNDNGYQATVTGVKKGTATIKHTWGYNSETFTVEVKETEPATVCYLKTPTSDPNSNDPGQWGKIRYGTAEVNVPGNPWVGKNAFSPSQYVQSYSLGKLVVNEKGEKTCEVGRGSDVWNEIFNAYKESAENELNKDEQGNPITGGNRLTITEDDVTAIYLVPYKISRNNSETSGPDKHLDCTVDIKCNKIVTAKFWVIMPNGELRQAYAKNFRIGNQLSAPALSKETYPDTMPYNGKTYVLDQGTWYTNPTCTNAATFPTTIKDDGEYQYYVKYKLQQTDIRGLTVNKPADVKYNGESQQQKPVVKDGNTVLKEGTNYTLNYSKDTTNVGTVTVTVTGIGNYSGSQEVTYKITPKAVTVTANSKTKVYGEKDPTLDAKVEGTLNGDAVKYTLSRKAGEDVGTYAITVTGNKEQGNYEVSFVNGDFEITPLDGIVVTITGHKDTVTYDGKQHGVFGYDAVVNDTLYNLNTDIMFVGGETQYAYVQGKDAGTYTMGLSAANFKNTNKNFENVTFNVTPGELVIEKRKVTLESATDNKVYDGTPLTRPDVKITGDGFVDGEVTDIHATGSVTNVSEGTVDNTITYTKGKNFKADNYVIVLKEGTLHITPVTDEVIVIVKGNSDTVVYDGKQHSVEGYEIVKINNELYHATDFVVNENKGVSVSGTDAGTYETVLKPVNTNKNFANVSFVVKDSELKITPAPLKITTNSAEKTYDGSALTAGGKIEGVAERDKNDVKLNITGSQTEVGSSKNTYTIEWGNANAENYKIAEEDIGTLKVNARSGGGSSSKPTPEEEPTPTPTPTPLPPCPPPPHPPRLHGALLARLQRSPSPQAGPPSRSPRTKRPRRKASRK